MIELTEQPSEMGTAVFTISPVDEDGNALTFAQLTNPQWQLMTSGGVVIDGCGFGDNVMDSLTVTLKGDQLAILSDGKPKRIFGFQAQYNSTAGSNLPLKDECLFRIKKLVSQADES